MVLSCVLMSHIHMSQTDMIYAYYGVTSLKEDIVLGKVSNISWVSVQLLMALEPYISILISATAEISSNISRLMMSSTLCASCCYPLFAASQMQSR